MALETDIMLLIVPMDFLKNCALPLYNVWDANLYHAKCTLTFVNALPILRTHWFWKWTTVDKVIWKKTLVSENNIMLVIVPMKFKKIVCTPIL